MNRILLCGTLAAFIASSAFAQSGAQASSSKTPTRPLILASDVIIGANIVLPKAKGAGEKVDSVSDLIVCADSGRIESLVLASGAVVCCDDVEWQPDTKCFCIASQSEANATGTVEASASRNTTEAKRATAGAIRHERILASKLGGCAITGTERAEKGRKAADLGAVGGMFIDVNSGHIAFVTTSIGGVLGMGADSKVIPWSAATLRCDLKDHEHELATTLSAKRLEKAPAFGTAQQKLHNPNYRCQLYSYYGCDRPDFDTSKNAPSPTQVTTLTKVLAADLRKVGENGEVSDLMINIKTGKSPFLMLDSGEVLSTSALKWDPKTACFVMTGSRKKLDIAERDNFLMARSLRDYPVLAADGECGALEALYFDTTTNELAFLTIATGTTMGFGGEVRVLPWHAVTIEKAVGDKPACLRLPMLKAQVEQAPKLDGAAGSDIQSPAFRQRVQKCCEAAK